MKDTKTESPTSSGAAHDSERCFVLIIRPGKAHDTKGPFNCKNVCPVLLSARALYPDAVLSVCEVTEAGALWATSENEWLHMMCPPNVGHQTPAAAGVESKQRAIGGLSA